MREITICTVHSDSVEFCRVGWENAFVFSSMKNFVYKYLLNKYRKECVCFSFEKMSHSSIERKNVDSKCLQGPSSKSKNPFQFVDLLIWNTIRSRFRSTDLLNPNELTTSKEKNHRYNSIAMAVDFKDKSFR